MYKNRDSTTLLIQVTVVDNDPTENFYYDIDYDMGLYDFLLPGKHIRRLTSVAKDTVSMSSHHDWYGEFKQSMQDAKDLYSTDMNKVYERVRSDYRGRASQSVLAKVVMEILGAEIDNSRWRQGTITIIFDH